RRHTRSKRDWSSDVCSSDLYIFRKRTNEVFFILFFLFFRFFFLSDRVYYIFRKWADEVFFTRRKFFISRRCSWLFGFRLFRSWRSEERGVGRKGRWEGGEHR